MQSRTSWTPSNPDMLRNLIEISIQKHLPPEQFHILQAAESERELMARLLAGVDGRERQ